MNNVNFIDYNISSFNIYDFMDDVLFRYVRSPLGDCYIVFVCDINGKKIAGPFLFLIHEKDIHDLYGPDYDIHDVIISLYRRIQGCVNELGLISFKVCFTIDDDYYGCFKRYL